MLSFVPSVKKNSQWLLPPLGRAAMARLELKVVINAICPWSGKPVRVDSLTRYHGQVVGFYNPACRDKFNAPAAISTSRSITWLEKLVRRANAMVSSRVEPRYHFINLVIHSWLATAHLRRGSGGYRQKRR
ncbi:hypothetical protein [uncultured Maricaulis sp.]|uniref:hypothetical protein n=1 Tax=uncultured Maricaulis sp. TaxID=174710 RepID=UPI0030D7008B